MDAKLNRAIQHAVNYHGLDTKLNMKNWQIADLITPEVAKHLAGTTDVQVIEKMALEQRVAILEKQLHFVIHALLTDGTLIRGINVPSTF